MPSIPGPYLVGSYITSHEEVLMSVEDEVTDNSRGKNGAAASDILEEMYSDAGLKPDRAKKTARRV